MIKHPQHREEALRKTCKAQGGKMHNFFFSFGKYDTMLLAELPDNKAAAALSVSAEAGGAVRMVHTTVSSLWIHTRTRPSLRSKMTRPVSTLDETRETVS